MAKVLEIHIAGRRAYITKEGGDVPPDGILTKRYAKAVRKMLKHWLKCH